METAGNVAGPLLAYEIITTFFLGSILEYHAVRCLTRKTVGSYTRNLLGRLWHHNVDLLDHRFEFMDAHTPRI